MLNIFSESLDTGKDGKNLTFLRAYDIIYL